MFPSRHATPWAAVSRRSLLLAVTAGASLAAVPWPDAQAADSSPFEILRQRWVSLVVGDGVDPADPALAGKIAAMSAAAQTLHASMDTSTTRTAVWSDLPIVYPNASNVSQSYDRLVTLAIAWATPGTQQYGDAGLASDLTRAMRFLYDKGYKPSLAWKGNWWFWEIGIPADLTTLGCLLYSEIDPADLALYIGAMRHFTPDPNAFATASWGPITGANRVDKAKACVLRGALSETATEIAAGRDALSDVARGGTNSLFRYATSGDGFYADGSFIQHARLPYVGTYGNVALAGLVDLFAVLGGSPWDITDPRRGVILDAIEKSFAPFIFDGHMMDTVRGRAVSRFGERDVNDAFATIGAMLQLTLGVGEPYRSRYRSLAKGWIERCTDVAYLDLARIPQVGIARALLADDTVEAAREVPGIITTPAQERTVVRGEGWAFTVSTSSNRIGRYEWGNSENNQGWYQGDGMTYVYRRDDLGHYSGTYWATVDPYRLPGTTVNDEPRQNGGANGTGIPPATSAWAGGVVAGAFATIGMDHRNADGTLVAKKSWFVTPTGVIALGAGITGTGGHAVRTIVENRNQHGTSSTSVTVDGTTRTLGDGASLLLSDPRWLYVPKLGGLSLPGGGSLRLGRDVRSGTWHDINWLQTQPGTTDTVSDPYLALWFDHGVDPTDATYAYRLLPGATSPDEARRAANQKVLVVANTATVQAIRVPSQRALLANFFGAGGSTGITADAACAVVACSHQATTTIAVSDPSHAEGTVTVTLPDVRADHTVSADEGIEVIGYAPLSIRATPRRGVGLTITVA